MLLGLGFNSSPNMEMVVFNLRKQAHVASGL